MQYPVVTFSGKSGEKYRFQVWTLDTRFKPLAAVYFVTKRSQDSSTYKRASHDSIFIGQTANLADPFGTQGQLDCFKKHGANCVCIYVHENEERRIAIEEDQIALHSTHCNQQARINRVFDAVA